jgi:hypothetical protein
MLEVKTSINQIQITMDSIISRQDETEERIWEMETTIEEVLHVNSHKEKKSWIQHVKTVGHAQKTKPKNLLGRRRNWITN